MTDKESCMKMFVNILGTSFVIGGISFGSFEFCNWYGCNGWTTFLRSDIICNGCTDISYHLKNYQTSLYGSLFTVVSYKMTSLINRAGASSDKYMFEDIIH
jgi:hypothetical protein|tara:strand:- start:3859 stop:4161 length:303 start_codon:yes stop_codon:yes gene_type:complete